MREDLDCFSAWKVVVVVLVDVDLLDVCTTAGGIVKELTPELKSCNISNAKGVRIDFDMVVMMENIILRMQLSANSNDSKCYQ